MFQLPSGSWGELLLTSRLSIFRVQLWHRLDLSTLRIHHRPFWMESCLLHHRQHWHALVSLLVLSCLRHTLFSSENISTGVALYSRKHWQSSGWGKWSKCWRLRSLIDGLPFAISTGASAEPLYMKFIGNASTLEIHPDIVAGMVHRYHNFRANLGTLRFHHSRTNVHENSLRIQYSSGASPVGRNNVLTRTLQMQLSGNDCLFVSEWRFVRCTVHLQLLRFSFILLYCRRSRQATAFVLDQRSQDIYCVVTSRSWSSCNFNWLFGLRHCPCPNYLVYRRYFDHCCLCRSNGEHRRHCAKLCWSGIGLRTDYPHDS